MKKKSLLSLLLFQFLILHLIGNSWNIQVIVTEDDCQDQYTFWGEDSLASNEYDNFDIVNWNPGITPWVDAYFPHPEWALSPGNYAVDIKSNVIEEKNWIFEIDTSTNGLVELNLQFNNVESLPEYYRCYFNSNGNEMIVNQNTSIDILGNAPFSYNIYTRFCPFISSFIDSVTVYYNIPNVFNLLELFGYYGSETMEFSYLNNENIDQTINDSIFTVSANNQWTGNTVSQIIAVVDNDSLFMDFIVNVFEHFYGDIDLNDSVDAYDASLVLQHLVQIILLSDQLQLRADVDNNQTIDAYDASLILRYAVGYISEFPVLLNRTKNNN